MSDTETEFETSFGMKLPRFHRNRGEDYGLWRHRLRAACRVKGVWGIVDITQASATTSDSTPDQALDSLRTMAKREKASGIIISALGDAPLRVVMDVDDNPSRI